ncbi:hypothetical protein GE21DRAFT_3691 [Neurospora crassa]|uniref:Far upstream element-binding protein 2 n=1 Tax=Neurospora crassa (strain ATCC 24698 / 74-OR23-1A / CBS 708.71 / DSM 1257 / FGSC 987) TaxID=367110 RepID=Q7S2N6_NEUCR|nr:far upstream element-binding protein 2 [Neurospora crassa OR74A]EAA29695.1 far upstream element-binding protein 2 [Neurospora crassa OR74A]KHE87251.1 hypothetical protein GE21DRAFT_3691 [Neurospora crassa]|eukprot:XP_958931.1 far upstream element-binding protein 2 [Neurospora crassa OR74A]
MAAPQQPDINSILQLLNATQRPASSTPTQSQPGLPAPAQPPMPPAAYAHPPQQPPAYPLQQPPYQQAPGYYPPPAASGGIDLSAVRPVNSGTVDIQDAVAKARAMAAENGLVPYEQSSRPYPPHDSRPHDSRAPDNRPYQRARSRSPRGRESYRDNVNPYRDERRGGDHGHHGGQSRDYGRERSFSPGRGRQGFSPRGGHGGGRDRSPLRGKEGDTETIQIESSLVGLIIGRQGENLRRVEGESRCRVQFVPPSSPTEQYRPCKITGPRAQREEAKEMINRIIRDSGMRGSAPADRPAPRDSGRGGSAAPPPLKEGEDSLQIMVPDRTVGLIIGRGGETIRDLQERSGCHINIVGENKSVNGLRPVNLIGTPAAAKTAKELILEIVDSDSRNASNPGGNRPPRGDNMGGGGGGGGYDKQNDSIFVPSEAVGMIIGKGGETIREMQNTTGCKINVSQSSGAGETEREIGLVGTREAINRAKRAIEDKVDAAKQKSSGGAPPRRGQHRDYDNPNYGQPSNNNSVPQQSLPAGNAAAPAGAGAQGDPYAMYGGYDNYVALWWQSQLAAAQGQGAAGQAPGTS